MMDSSLAERVGGGKLKSEISEGPAKTVNQSNDSSKSETENFILKNPNDFAHSYQSNHSNRPLRGYPTSSIVRIMRTPGISLTIAMDGTITQLGRAIGEPSTQYSINPASIISILYHYFRSSF